MPSLPAKFRIAASLMTISLVGGAFAFLFPSGNFLPRELRSYHTSANVPAAARTYREGSRLYLDNGTVKVGLETNWGGSIVEVIWHGMNFVNDYDTGREVQVAFYDGDSSPLCGDCAGGLGWDPVQGGDWHVHGSPILAQTLGKDSVYIKTQPHHWYPDNKEGGGPDKPIPSDVTIEQWISFLRDYPVGVKAHYKVTHFGSDRHSNSYQEFPAVYTNWEFNRFVYYGGMEPWTSGQVTYATPLPPSKPVPTLFTPEQWGALVNDQDIGLTVFVPGQYPYASTVSHPPTAKKNSGTNYFAPRTTFSFGPGSVLEADIYLFGGDYKRAREAIYSLEKTIPPRDPFTPDGYVDLPKRDAELKGSTVVSGWAFDNDQVSEVDVLVDEHLAGRADYGTPRPDVSNTWPHAPVSIGFRYTLDTTQYPNGKHLVGVNAKDPAGNIAVFPRIPIVIDNPKQPETPLALSPAEVTSGTIWLRRRQLQS